MIKIKKDNKNSLIKRLPRRFLGYNLYKRLRTLLSLSESERNYIIKTKSRSSVIYPCFVDLTIFVYSGKKYIPVKIKRYSIGHKLGEFVPTRKNVVHKKKNVGTTIKKRPTVHKLFFNFSLKKNFLFMKRVIKIT